MTEKKYKNLDTEDLLEPLTEAQQKIIMDRKLTEIAAEEEKAAKKALLQRQLKLTLTPRQDRCLRRLKREWGMSVSELTRRALDEYLDRLIARGDLNDNK